MPTQIVTIADRPDLAATVARWIWNEFSRHDGYTLERLEPLFAAATARRGAPQCFVALEDGRPVATANLALQDLDERPNLTPWLAGVYTIPEARNRGHAKRLIAAVEAACQAAAIPTAWLYTNTAEPLYAALGWRRTELVPRGPNPPVTLMRKDFPTPEQQCNERPPKSASQNPPG